MILVMPRRAISRTALLAALAIVGSLGLAFFHCAEPTQIVLDIRTDGCRQVKSTGIAVTTLSSIDQAPLSTFKAAANGTGCETQDRIGTLTVYPSGDDKEGEVGFRIVVGIDKNAAECEPPWTGCLVARRRARFEPGTSRQLIVIMALNCKGKDCGLGNDCTPSGACVRLPGEDGVDFDGGAPADTAAPPVEAGFDACSTSCNGIGQSCNGGLCKNDCSLLNCGNPAICPPDLDCTYECPTSTSCNDARCQSQRACRIECNAADSCRGAVCNAPRCDIVCNVADSCRDVALSGNDAGLTCVSPAGDPCRGSARCDAGKCTLVCTPGGGDNGTCPNNPTCTTQPTATQCVGPWQ